MRTLPYSNTNDLISFFKDTTSYDHFCVYDLDKLKDTPHIVNILKRFYCNDENYNEKLIDSLANFNLFISKIEFEYQNPKVLIMSKSGLIEKNINIVLFDETKLGITFPYRHEQFRSKYHFIIEPYSLVNHFDDKKLTIDHSVTREAFIHNEIISVSSFSIPLINWKMDCRYNLNNQDQAEKLINLILFREEENLIMQLFNNVELIKERLFSLDFKSEKPFSVNDLLNNIEDFLFPFAVSQDFFNNIQLEEVSSLAEYMEAMEVHKDTYKMYKI